MTEQIMTEWMMCNNKKKNSNNPQCKHCSHLHIHEQIIGCNFIGNCGKCIPAKNYERYKKLRKLYAKI